MDVLTFFKEIDGDFDKAAKKEAVKYCEISPCVVSNIEDVARQIRSPHHLNDDGEITPAAFSDAKDKGLSINRLSYCSEDDVHASGLDAESRQYPEKKWRYVGLTKAKVEEIRNIFLETEEKRAFFIYDTALVNNHSHGDVVQLASEVTKVVGRAAGQRLRKKLKDAFESTPAKPDTF